MTLDEVFARDVTPRAIIEGDAGGDAKGARMDIVQMAAAAKQARPDYDVSANGQADAPMRGRSLVETDAASCSEPLGHTTRLHG